MPAGAPVLCRRYCHAVSFLRTKRFSRPAFGRLGDTCWALPAACLLPASPRAPSCSQVRLLPVLPTGPGCQHTSGGLAVTKQPGLRGSEQEPKGHSGFPCLRRLATLSTWTRRSASPRRDPLLRHPQGPLRCLQIRSPASPPASGLPMSTGRGCWLHAGSMWFCR